MELDFDKEINALLRQAARSGEFVSTTEQNHLDADEISAFAENALPEKTREFYIKHFADCDRCRTILSNTILLNQEAETEAASSAVAAPIVPEIIETKVPWYRKMFLMPNLAYTMGALVLIFGGAFGFLVLQNISQNTGSEVSQIQDNETRSSGPNAGDSAIAYNSNSAATISNKAVMSNASNTSSNTTSTSSATAANSSAAATAEKSPNVPAAANETSTADIVTESKDQNQELAKQSKENDFQLDGADSKAARKTEVKSSEKNKKDAAEISPDDEAEQPISGAPPPAPMSAAQPSITQRRAENMPKGEAAPKKRADARLNENEATRRISGKTFNRVGGVWVDSAYNKSDSSNMILPTTRTIRRGSSEYQKLDKQVRIIAESLSGAVIIVWKNGAYRIQ